MILRRIAEHMKLHQWKHVIIELVIVVLGVFIGLQADNWNQARIERGMEITYLASLSHDVNFSIGELEKSERSLIDAERARAALYHFSITPGATLSDDQLNLYLRNGLFYYTGQLNISQVTFQTLKSSGHLDVIKSPRLISKLQYMSSIITRVENGQADELEVTHLFSDPFLIDHFDLRGVFQMPVDKGFPRITWLDKQRLPMPRPDVLKSVRMRNIILYRSQLSEGRLAGIRKLIEVHREVARLIKARQEQLGIHA